MQKMKKEVYRIACVLPFGFRVGPELRKTLINQLIEKSRAAGYLIDLDGINFKEGERSASGVLLVVSSRVISRIGK